MVMATQISSPSDAYRSTPTRLPILILNVHSNCNCRCLMCDIWQTKNHSSLRGDSLDRHRGALRNLGVRHVVFTGGEPLLNADLPAISAFLRDLDIRITLLSTGLLLKKRAAEIPFIADDVIVSLDGPAAIHDSIRRVAGAFALIGEGISAVRAHAPRMPIAARCTVQKTNHLHLCDTVSAAQQLGLDSISFLAVDVTSDAFNRPFLWPTVRQSTVALTSEETEALDHEIDCLVRTHADAFRSGFILEPPAKLRRIVRNFRVHLGQQAAEAPRCNAPWVSAVLELNGDVRPCFFHPPYGNIDDAPLDAVVTGYNATRFRESLDVATNPACQRCVCSLNYKEEDGSIPQKSDGPIRLDEAV